MKKNCFLVFIFIVNLHAQEGRLIRNPIRNIPKWVRTEFSAQHLGDRYSVIYQLYPYYLKGDFNGDGRRDVAIQIAESKSGKIGIAIFHTKKPQAISVPVSIFGAGNHFSGAGDDFKWVNIWDIVDRKQASDGSERKKIPTFEGDVISIRKRDSTGGLIYWDGKKYAWYKIKDLE